MGEKIYGRTRSVPTLCSSLEKLKCHSCLKYTSSGSWIPGIKGFVYLYLIREAVKKKSRSKLGHCPNREGGWLMIKLIFQTAYEIFGKKFYSVLIPMNHQNNPLIHSHVQ
jgi:hypothetical protein